MRVLLVILCSVVLGACNGLLKKDKVPGGELPQLTSSQEAQTKIMSGSVGDIIHYINEVNTSSTARASQFRKTKRNALKASIFSDACVFKNTGDKKNKFYFSMSGNGCAVRIKADREKDQQGDISGSYRISESSRIDFFANNNLVSSDIKDLTLRGEEETSVKTEGDLYFLKRSLTLRGEVVSKTKGSFEYGVKMALDRVVDFANSAKNSEVFERADSFVFVDFKVVVYKKVSMVDGKVTEKSHYINGIDISENEYQALMQDLDLQINYRENK